MTVPWRPSSAQRIAARSKVVRDVIAPNLDVLFCGINPGLYSAAVGHHFAGPANRFWPTLHAAGFTPYRFTAFDERSMLPLGLGITNLVSRASASADEITASELRAGTAVVRRKVTRYSPRFLAVVGLSAFRTAFDAPKASVGPYPLPFGDTRVWLLPNPSGLNAHYQPALLRDLFVDLRRAAGIASRRGRAASRSRCA